MLAPLKASTEVCFAVATQVAEDAAAPTFSAPACCATAAGDGGGGGGGSFVDRIADATLPPSLLAAAIFAAVLAVVAQGLLCYLAWRRTRRAPTAPSEPKALNGGGKAKDPPLEGAGYGLMAGDGKADDDEPTTSRRSSLRRGAVGGAAAGGGGARGGGGRRGLVVLGGLFAGVDGGVWGHADERDGVGDEDAGAELDHAGGRRVARVRRL